MDKEIKLKHDALQLLAVAGAMGADALGPLRASSVNRKSSRGTMPRKKGKSGSKGGSS